MSPDFRRSNAGVISQDDRSRFGWHDLRHSLASFFGSNNVHPSLIQRMLRHANQRTTARYIHPANADQIAAQKKFLDAIKNPWNFAPTVTSKSNSG